MNDAAVPLVPDLPLPSRHHEQSLPTTKARQKAFLVALSQCGTYKHAAELTGVEPHTISRWVKRFPQFKELADEAKAHADKYYVADAIEHNFYQRAVAGKEDGQSAIIGMFTLKRINPQYRENAQVNLTVAGPAAIQMNFGASKQIAQAEEQASSETT